jgi:transposase
MPWSQTSPMDQRTQFIADYLRGCLSITELCALYDVSRKTGYKWIDRYLRYGPAGLDERSRKPRASPNQTDQEIVTALLESRRRHPSWGAKKLLVLLHKGHPRWELPGRSTVCDILSRHGMVPKQRQRRRIGHPGKPTSSILAPNDLWCADYKGQFKTGNGIYCYPLTVTDGYGRYLLSCQARLLHGTGMRVMEGMRLRDKDMDFARREILIRDGKGYKDRVTVLPRAIESSLREQLEHIGKLHRHDLAAGFGAVWLPYAPARNTRKQTENGRGSTSFQRPHARAMRAPVLFAAITSPIRRSSARCDRPCAMQGSRSPRLRTRCATPARPISWSRATISGPCKNCSGTATSARR